MRTGVANLPLHPGKAPRWLFQRMEQLAREMAIILVTEFGTTEFLRRIADPYWFQATGCVMGFDWHSSGVTTTVNAAFAEGIKGLENELGLYIAGGKGKRSRQTPAMIESFAGEAGLGTSLAADLVYASRMSAKVDSAALQDGYQIYQHTFYFDRSGNWAVVQQGMNERTRYARRYHWLSTEVSDFVDEPQAAICSQVTTTPLNLVAHESAETRCMTVDIACAQPVESLLHDLDRVQSLDMPARHEITPVDFNRQRLMRIISTIREHRPETFERLLGLPGVGPRTIKALALVSELVYGTKLSWRDPARYSFAHGGKDGIPFPVDRPTYDQTIETMRWLVGRMKLDRSEAQRKLKQLELLFD
ncbi:MAG TPA: DUF763 domain-containing protein [bacterium]|nr:DUF763 domain-containing protein [bacterium]